MSDVDLNKLKVAELREELATRGLDTKGVKAALVKRLKTAMNKEAKELAHSQEVAYPQVDEPEDSEAPSQEAEAELEAEEPKSDLDTQEEVENEPSKSEEPPEEEIPPIVEESEEPRHFEGVEEVETSEPNVQVESEPSVQESVEVSEDSERPTEFEEDSTPAVELENMDSGASIEEGDSQKFAVGSTGQFSADIEMEGEDARAANATEDDDQHIDAKPDVTEGDEQPTSEASSQNAECQETGEPMEQQPAICNSEENVDDESRGIKRKRDDELSEVPTDEGVENGIKQESAPPPVKERKTRWSSMKVEKEEYDETLLTLDTYNSDLNLSIDASRFSAHPLTNEGFAFMWAGARATHGITKGKTCFELKVVQNIDISHLPSDEPNPHVVRVGFSVDSSTMQLGEDPLSYGYGGTGKISTNCQFKDYGTTFGEGDCITALLNKEADSVEIGFSKNGTFLGWAYKVDNSQLGGQALFPHVLTKNCSFDVNFGHADKPFFQLPDGFQDYTFIACIPADLRVRGSKPPATREDCEMIMMCGLPGAGKSVWCADYSSKNSEKKYNILGTNNIIDKMKVMGLPRKKNYHGRWDVLIQMATKCLNKLFEIGSKLRRNFILDQTNVYPTAQRRKMRNFDGFKRKSVVIVPTDEEYRKRCDKRDREEGKEVPDHAVNEMKANFKLPEVSDIFDEVEYIELDKEEAEKLVKTYNEEGRAAVGPANRKFHSGGNDQSSPARNNNRFGGGGFDRDRNKNFGGSNRGGPGGNRQFGPNRGGGGFRGGFDRGGPRGGFGNRGRDGGFGPPRGGGFGGGFRPPRGGGFPPRGGGGRGGFGRDFPPDRGYGGGDGGYGGGGYGGNYGGGHYQGNGGGYGGGDSYDRRGGGGFKRDNRGFGRGNNRGNPRGYGQTNRGGGGGGARGNRGGGHWPQNQGGYDNQSDYGSYQNVKTETNSNVSSGYGGYDQNYASYDPNQQTYPTYGYQAPTTQTAAAPTAQWDPNAAAVAAAAAAAQVPTTTPTPEQIQQQWTQYYQQQSQQQQYYSQYYGQQAAAVAAAASSAPVYGTGAYTTASK